ncbi:MAG: aminotransferase class I/II-fold pyridoxal phosphate-dependent enzyme, partial [Chloroflexi bacterium]|nr:aminotransferase class I/II-fold pyridoxal phosphate-dependent enzyme [Chloroflexota bacterium]
MTAGSSSSSSRHPRPVPWIEALVPATHGSIDAHGSERNLGPKVLDFSANGNVIGPSQTVAPALAAVDLSRYPDRYALELRRAIAKCDGVDIEEVVAGNGSTELIWAVARAYLAPGDRALVVSPAYGEYAVASLASGAQVESVWTFHPEVAVRGGPLPSNEDAVSESALAANNAGDLVELLKPALVEMPPKVVWICHPNNPTGRLFPVEALPELIRLAPGTLFAVDEAYLTLCAGVTSVLPLLGTGQ